MINTALGPIIDLDSLAEAMRGCRSADAGLEVLPKEPADPRHPHIAAWTAREDWLRGRPLLTPHAAFYNPAAMQDMPRKAGSPIANREFLSPIAASVGSPS